jgi:hypothetical protein
MGHFTKFSESFESLEGSELRVVALVSICSLIIMHKCTFTSIPLKYGSNQFFRTTVIMFIECVQLSILMEQSNSSQVLAMSCSKLYKLP